MSANMDVYCEFGISRFAPFLYGFIRWLKNELKRKKYEKVFFFSRDGYMMKKAFELINDTNIRSEYVYFSRKSLRRALLYNCADFEKSLEYLSWERYVRISKLFDYYGFSEDICKEMMSKYKLDTDTAIAYDELKNNNIIRSIYEDNSDSIKSFSKKQHELLLDYTEQVGMRGKFAIVDIGWHGNMQYFLDQFFKLNDLDLSYEGFYIGIKPDKELLTNVNGYVYNPENPVRRKNMLCFLGCIEKLLQSTEGSAKAYMRLDDGTVIPELSPYEYDTEKDKHIIEAINSWQAGALDEVKNLHVSDKYNSDEELIRPLLRFGMYPTLKDTELFSFFYNIDGSKLWYTAQKPLYRYKLKDLKIALAESPWKTGFMKSLFKIPFPYYYIYSLLRK